MITVVCVWQGDAFGLEYVERLHDMVRRNLPDGFSGRFVCLTDRPGDLSHLPGIQTRTLTPDLHGWWAKMDLFKPGQWERGERIWYFDLDTVITGPLDKLFEYSGAFAILQDVYRPNGLQSSVMSFIGGTALCESIFTLWLEANAPLLRGGDQEWLEQFFNERLPKHLGGPAWPPDILQSLYPGVLRSYKVDCVWTIPTGASVVFFHGYPRPHEVTEGWVPEVWKVGGGFAAVLEMIGTVDQNTLMAHVADAMRHKYPQLAATEGHNQLAVICGGSPSLKDNVPLIAALQYGGAVVFSCNNVDGFMREHGVTPNFHAMMDGREDLADWVQSGGIKLYGSICHPSTLKNGAERGNLVIWHPVTPGINQVLGKAMLIGGGSTIGTRCMALAYVMGFRRIHCFGMDSSYAEDAHHAYTQPLNDGERILDVISAGKRFRASGWMAKQAEDWKEITIELLRLGCEIAVTGEGLIPHLAGHLSIEPTAADERSKQLLAWLESTKNPVGAEIGVFAGDLSRRLLLRADLSLILVDSWTTSTADSNYAQSDDFHSNLTQEEQDAFYDRTKYAVGFAKDRARILRKTSIEAAAIIPDASLDFVFIDADHSYAGCAADIAAWLPKIKPTGFLSGHDYENTKFPKFGVKRAVDEAFGTPELGENFTWRVQVAHLHQQQRKIQ